MKRMMTIAALAAAMTACGPLLPETDEKSARIVLRRE